MVKFLFIKRCFSPIAGREVRGDDSVLLNLTDKTIHQSLLTENFAHYKHVSPEKQQINSLRSYITLLPPRKLNRARFPSFPLDAVASSRRRERISKNAIIRPPKKVHNITFCTPRRKENKSNVCACYVFTDQIICPDV